MAGSRLPNTVLHLTRPITALLWRGALWQRRVCLGRCAVAAEAAHVSTYPLCRMKRREERARLAEPLISSLEREADADADALWLREAERRLEEIESGGKSAITAESAIERAR